MMKCGLLFLMFITQLLATAWSAQAPEKQAVPSAQQPEDSAANTRAYAQRIERELRDDILPFWIAHTVDREHGGFHGEISNDLVVKKNAPRGALLTARILWTYSAAYRRYHDAAYLEMAQWAFHDLLDHFWDQEHGGFFWSITVRGQPLGVDKQVYGQAFGIYALSEFYRATGEPEALARATQLYHLLEEHARDQAFGGYFEACGRDWQRKKAAWPMSDVMGSRGSKSQNTHLHVLEAYTELLRIWPDQQLRKSQSDLVELMLTKITDAQTHHLILFMNDDWSPRSDGISFGHDIEASWLLVEAADVQGEPGLRERVRSAALAMARVVLESAIDSDGSLLYEADPRGITDTTREWWPQAEAVVGLYSAYQLSHDERYRQAAFNVWQYIEAHLIDRKNGEWYRSVTKAGVISRAPKVSLWKCPYHNGRACLQMIERLGAGP